MDNSALINEFLVESFENLSSINSDLTQFEKEPDNKELLNSIYRTVHTLKGSASFLGFKKLMDITHSAENLLDELREDKFRINSNIIDALLESFDICNVLLAAIEDEGQEGSLDIEKNKLLLEELLILQGELFAEDKSEDQSKEKEEVKIEVKDTDIVPDDAPDVDKQVDVQAEGEKTVSDTGTGPESDPGTAVVIDDELSSLLSSHRSTDSATDTVPAGQEENVSAAALDSIKDLIASGAVDASILDDLDLSGVSAEAISDIKQETTVKESKKESKDEIKTDSAINPTPKLNIVDKDLEKKDIATGMGGGGGAGAPGTPGGNEPKQGSIADSFVRVNVKVLDKIMNIVGELVLNRNQIVQYSNIKSEHEYTRLSQQLNIITSELQSEVMSTRMQPVGSILTKFERLVRDFSRQSGKKISLQLFGTETELDKTLIEAIKDPLVHIIRNACDHGLETIEERDAAGKTGDGVITIKSYNESGQVTIEIVDNGRGLHREKIGAKAIEKGIIDQEQFARMTDVQIFGLIFAPGFSTAEKITNISGRGVGMDVVKTNIEKIGGSVSVNSIWGTGTTFKLRIPLTLAIVPALIIKSKGEAFAIPQLNLNELVRLETTEEKEAMENIQGSEFLKLRGVLTPVFNLSDILKLTNIHERNNKLKSVMDSTLMHDSEREDLQEQKELENKDYDDAYNIVIMTAENTSFGIIVDEVLDTEEIVVKPLDNSLKHISMFGGATIMGDGQVALILDAVGFINTVCVDRDINTDTDAELQADIQDSNSHNLLDKHESLLFRLNDDRIYALPLSLVARLEEIDTEKIEKTGNQPITRYLDAPMPLINLEKSLGLKESSSLDSYKSEGPQAISCIVSSLRGVNYGLVVKEILDISMDDAIIDDTAVDRDGILGTVFIQGKTISLLDLYSIINAQAIGRSSKHNMDGDKKTTNKKYSVLVVDDSPMYRKMIYDLMAEQGYQVGSASHGEEAFEMTKENDYDLVVTDIEMPVLDGYAYAKKVRSELKNKNQKILALSTKYSDRDRQRGIDAGFDFHMEKFKRDEIIDQINEIFSES